MSEHTEVEQPFLRQVQDLDLGRQTIDQGTGIPTEPPKSLRCNTQAGRASTWARLRILSVAPRPWEPPLHLPLW
jgi:hypothetical protein